MRCLVKNLAMFGLGLYVYAGEDLPEKSFETIDEELTILAATLNKINGMYDCGSRFRHMEKQYSFANK